MCHLFELKMATPEHNFCVGSRINFRCLQCFKILRGPVAMTNHHYEDHELQLFKCERLISKNFFVYQKVLYLVCDNNQRDVEQASKELATFAQEGLTLSEVVLFKLRKHTTMEARAEFENAKEEAVEGIEKPKVLPMLESL